MVKAKHILILGIVTITLLSCAPKTPELTILEYSVSDSIKIHDPDNNPDNGWLSSQDTLTHFDSTLVRLKVAYQGPADGYITDVLWRVKNPRNDSLINTYSAIFYPPILIRDGQSINLNFYISFDNKTAHRVDSLYDSTVNMFGEGMVELYLSGSTYQQILRSNKVSFNLRFVP